MRLAEQKKHLRREMKGIMLSIVDREKRSEELKQKLVRSGSLQNLHRVSIFLSLSDEVQTMSIIEYCWEQGISVTVPEFHNHRFGSAVEVREWRSEGDLVETRHGIFHPQEGAVFAI